MKSRRTGGATRRRRATSAHGTRRQASSHRSVGRVGGTQTTGAHLVHLAGSGIRSDDVAARGLTSSGRFLIHRGGAGHAISRTLLTLPQHRHQSAGTRSWCLAVVRCQDFELENHCLLMARLSDFTQPSQGKERP